MHNPHRLFLALTVTAVACTSGATAQHEPRQNELKTSASGPSCSEPVALDVSAPRPAFTLTVAGKSVPAILDTGAMTSTVNVDFSDHLQLANEGPLKAPFDRYGQGFQSTIRNASIGNFPLPDHSVAVMPSPLPDKAVILSPATFTGSLVQIDFKTGQMLICKKNWSGRPKGVGFAYKQGGFALPAVRIVAGGEQIDALLDSGSPFEISLPTSFAKKMKLSEALKKVGEAGVHGGVRTPIFAARIAGSLEVGPVKLDNPRVFFTDLSSGANIGMKLLKRLVVTIDPEAKQAWVQLAEAG